MPLTTQPKPVANLGGRGFRYYRSVDLFAIDLMLSQLTQKLSQKGLRMMELPGLIE